MSRTCPTCHTAYPDDAFFCGLDGHVIVQDQAPADFDPRVGRRMGGYIAVARVADGATGRVYEGRHPDTKARVAIKVLHDFIARDAVAVERFRREYETAHELSDPYLIKALEFGETGDGSYFFTMEYLEGQELSKLLELGPLSGARALRVLCQCALALQHAHSFGFIHRDLKPDNVFLCDTSAGPVIRLLDFGSVKLQMETGPKLTAVGITLGSPYYMSPEQATGAADVDQRSDVFALGAILYEMLTGKVAFEAKNVALILMKIMNEHPVPASAISRSCPPALDDVIDRVLSKKKADRYQSALAFAEATLLAMGLSEDVRRWAEVPEVELQAALAQAKPPAPRPFASAQAASTQVTSEPPLALSLRESSTSLQPRVPRHGGALKVTLALGAALVLGLLVYFIR